MEAASETTSSTGSTERHARTLEAVAAAQRDVDAVDDRIGLLAAQIHALEAELLGELATFDEMDGWHGVGYRSFGHWLSVRAKFTPAEATRLTSLAGKLDRVPQLLDDARHGMVSSSLLAAAARVSTPDNQERVADVVRLCTPAQALRVLAKYRDLRPTVEDADGDTPHDRPEPEPDYWWRAWSDDQGRGRIDAALDEVTAALLGQAWRAAQAAGETPPESDPESDPTTTPEPSPVSSLDERRRREDPNEIARRLATTMLDDAHAGGLCAPGGERFAVQVTVDLATLAQVLGITLDPSLPVRLGSECFLASSGRHLQDHELAAILCDANLQLLVEQDGVPLWLGNEVRTFNRQQRRAMRRRSGGHGGCEFPGCTQTRYLYGHHVVFHGDEGPTTLDNGILLCGWHHRRLHREGWTITTDGDQRFTFWNGSRCLGTTTRAHGPGGRPPDLVRLEPVDAVPDPPPELGPDSPRSESGGEAMTAWALDNLLHQLLAA